MSGGWPDRTDSRVTARSGQIVNPGQRVVAGHVFEEASDLEL